MVIKGTMYKFTHPLRPDREIKWIMFHPLTTYYEVYGTEPCGTVT